MALIYNFGPPGPGSPVPPSQPYEGQAWIDTSVLPVQLKVFDNGVWVTLATGGAGTPGGAPVPFATAPDQVLVSENSPAFPWKAQPTIDSGRY